MTKKIYCSHFKTELEALTKTPMPGELGKKIVNNLSKKAWEEWIRIQTMIINENRLNLMNETDRDFVKKELLRFINGEEVLKPKDFKE